MIHCRDRCVRAGGRVAGDGRRARQFFERQTIEPQRLSLVDALAFQTFWSSSSSDAS